MVCYASIATMIYEYDLGSTDHSQDDYFVDVDDDEVDVMSMILVQPTIARTLEGDIHVDATRKDEPAITKSQHFVEKPPNHEYNEQFKIVIGAIDNYEVDKN